MIEKRVKEIICDCLCEKNVNGITLTGIDSPDILDIILRIENEYDIHIDKKEAAKLVTIDALVFCIKNKLNEKGKNPSNA